MPEYNQADINWNNTIHVEDLQKAMSLLNDWYKNQFLPAYRAYLDVIVEWWNKYMVPALDELMRTIARFLVGLRRGLMVTRWYCGCPMKARPWFPWRVSRWLARRWPERLLPRFQEGDDLLDDLLAALNMWLHLSDPTW